MKNHKPFPCLSFKRLETTNPFIGEELFSISAGEGFNYIGMLLCQA